MSALPIPADETQVSACICCGEAEWLPKFRVLRECKSCGFVRADMDLTHEQVRKLYQEDYFQGEEYGDYLADQESHRKNFAARLKTVQRIAGDIPSLFEIGCAYGFWLEQCQKAGIDCAGVDVCAEPVRHARMVMGQNAQLGDFLSIPLAKERYQAYCMWDTIEHLANPEHFISRVHGLLPDGGWLFLTTGDIGSLSASTRGPKWRMIHPPTHLQYFSTASMKRFLTRQGFEVVRSQSTPMHRNIGETVERVANLGKGAPKSVAKAIRRVMPRWLKKMGFWLDLGDIMFIAARKVK